MVGVNKFQVNEEISLESLKIDPKIEQDQHERLAALRASRDNQMVEALLNKLEQTANSDAN